MGIYVYKVVGETVLLENGERAHLAFYAYKDAWGNPANIHTKTGCGRCDTECRKGKRGNWIIYASKEDDGSIKIFPYAKRSIKPRGSYFEEFDFDDFCAVEITKLPKKYKLYELAEYDEEALRRGVELYKEKQAKKGKF